MLDHIAIVLLLTYAGNSASNRNTYSSSSILVNGRVWRGANFYVSDVALGVNKKRLNTDDNRTIKNDKKF
jgi:hypothetical protein